MLFSSPSELASYEQVARLRTLHLAIFSAVTMRTGTIILTVVLAILGLLVTPGYGRRFKSENRVRDYFDDMVANRATPYDRRFGRTPVAFAMPSYEMLMAAIHRWISNRANIANTNIVATGKTARGTNGNSGALACSHDTCQKCLQDTSTSCAVPCRNCVSPNPRARSGGVMPTNPDAKNIQDVFEVWKGK